MAFWAAYPRHVKKQAAWKAWQKIGVGDDLLAVILASVERHKKSRQWLEGYVEHPTTWLNGRQWEDEVEVRPPAPPPGAPQPSGHRARIEALFARNGSPRPTDEEPF